VQIQQFGLKFQGDACLLVVMIGATASEDVNGFTIVAKVAI
jgi:hypothetical protein